MRNARLDWMARAAAMACLLVACAREADTGEPAPFRFVNTHLEALDPSSVHPSIRAQQAGEIVAAGGPASGTLPVVLVGDLLPVVLVGDLNSDDDTLPPDDQQAYRVLLGAGFVERSTAAPLSCCIHSYDLTTGMAAELDHQVDHIMTDTPDAVQLVESFVTGREQHHGYWNSDHAGVVSVLRIRSAGTRP